jgi:Uma2 family endonuclease
MQHKTLTPIEDDTEDAPWMVMGTPQFNSTRDFSASLEAELRRRDHPLFVAGILPILYYPIPGGRREQLAPDILVAPVQLHDRSSYQVDREGAPPSFVLEVVSPESATRDLEVKPPRYERMGVREYALFAPEAADGTIVMRPQLQGYRLDAGRGEFVEWKTDLAGRLYSEVLDLWLVVRDGELRAQRTDGTWLLTFEEAEAARQSLADSERQLEEEVARLRAELERR